MGSDYTLTGDRAAPCKRPWGVDSAARKYAEKQEVNGYFLELRSEGAMEVPTHRFKVSF